MEEIYIEGKENYLKIKLSLFNKDVYAFWYLSNAYKEIKELRKQIQELRDELKSK